MTTRSKMTTFSRASMSSLGAFVAVATLAANALISSPAQALPGPGATCKVITYYSDAAKTNQVGTSSTCPGNRGLHGRRTAYFEVDTIPLGNQGPRPTKGPGHLPCEFLAAGCGNLPVEHH